MAVVYEKGLVLLPKYIRDALGLVKGSKVNFRLENNKAVIEPANATLEEFRKIRATATRSQAEVDKHIELAKKKMLDEWSRVP